jgi:dTDP-4-dehydrorhamnose 3,5-epimerase
MVMKLLPTAIPEVIEIEPDIYPDMRGFLMETYQKKRYEGSGIRTSFVQDNLSYSVQKTLRGLHYQHPHGQAKLVQVLKGEIFDAVVDIRHGSPSFGRWVGVQLSEKDKHQLFIPEGFAHGFCVLSKMAVVYYKCSDFYTPGCEGGILCSDPDIGIEWPISGPLLSEKDSRYSFLTDLPVDRLPIYKGIE